MNDTNNELKRMLNSDIEALEQAKTDAIARANYQAGYLAGQIDAKKQMRDALLASADLPEELDEDAEPGERQSVDVATSPAAGPSAVQPTPKLNRKEERKRQAEERSNKSNGHSKEPVPAGAL